MNLKKETIHVLKEHGKKVDEVRWVGGKDFVISTELFWKLADQEYDDGYGSPEVAEDLVVVGDDWWLERHEYDGSEWWEFKALPTMPEGVKAVQRVLTTGVGWNTLAELNKNTCNDCEHFIGGGDWSLCCDLPHPEAAPYGFLCYKDTPACDLFKLKGDA